MTDKDEHPPTDHPADYLDVTQDLAQAGWWIMPAFIIGTCTIAALIWGASHDHTS